MKKEKVICALSGGVDSAVSAKLLLDAGYHVEAMYMQNWEEDNPEATCTQDDLQAARRVAEHLGIYLHTVNFAPEYWHQVFAKTLAEYKAGNTPNPDILCNKEIKFNVFKKTALDLGADKMATGHYVRKEKKDEHWLLKKGIDANKDQSYFLYTLNQAQLDFSLFPVGELKKPSVREIAKQLNLPNFNRKDSTGICFIGERRFKSFLSQYFPTKPGDICDEQGQVIGQHDGLMFYTIGQRKGLNIGGIKGIEPTPWYVVDKNLQTNTLTCAHENSPALYKNTLIATDCDFVAGNPPTTPGQITAKTRYRQADQVCTLSPLDNTTFQVTFPTPQRAITPGQSVVFYNGDICLGGGIIRLNHSHLL